MTSGDPGLTLAEGMTRSGMTVDQLWLRYLGVGGDAGEMEVEAYLLGLLRVDPFEHDLIAQALNEYFIDHGGNHPVAYSCDRRV
jgi:hypothetical protein